MLRIQKLLKLFKLDILSRSGLAGQFRQKAYHFLLPLKFPESKPRVVNEKGILIWKFFILFLKTRQNISQLQSFKIRPSKFLIYVPTIRTSSIYGFKIGKCLGRESGLSRRSVENCQSWNLHTRLEKMYVGQKSIHCIAEAESYRGRGRVGENKCFGQVFIPSLLFFLSLPFF